MTTAVAIHLESSQDPGIAPLASALAAFVAPSEQLLGRRELLRRVDSKFVVKASRLASLIAGLERDYAAFRIETGAIATYQSLYFDTPDLKCFHDHRRGRRLRHKIRIRHYPDRAISYLEIKAKRSELVTHKHRIKIPFGSEALGPEELAFLRAHLGAVADALRPELRINYRRIGLLGLSADERVTIDLELDFVGMDGAVRRMGEAAIVEVKQTSATRGSPIGRRLSAEGAREQKLSKYTTAITVLRPEVRKNRLLVDLRAVERIMR
jgi:hypothetical protein